MNPPIPKMTTNSFFSGVGGLDYGLELAGFKTVSMCKLRDLGQRAIKLKEDQASGRLVIVTGPEDIKLTNAGGAVSPQREALSPLGATFTFAPPVTHGGGR